MEHLVNKEWPSELLGRILHFLAMDGASFAWHHLAYLTHKNESLKRMAKSMKRPLVLRIAFWSDEKFTSFILPFQRAKTISIEVDWGDGTPTQIIEQVGEGGIRHEYATRREYLVQVFPYGDGINGVWLDHLGGDRDDRSKRFRRKHWWRPLQSLDSLGSLGISSLQALFFRARVIHTKLSILDVSGIVNMRDMFHSAGRAAWDIARWNVSNVTDMNSMFLGISYLNPRIGVWKVGRVRDMGSMFDGSHFNRPIEHLALECSKCAQYEPYVFRRHKLPGSLDEVVYALSPDYPIKVGKWQKVIEYLVAIRYVPSSAKKLPEMEAGLVKLAIENFRRRGDRATESFLKGLQQIRKISTLLDWNEPQL